LANGLSWEHSSRNVRHLKNFISLPKFCPKCLAMTSVLDDAQPIVSTGIRYLGGLGKFLGDNGIQ